MSVQYKYIKVSRDSAITTVMINRPDVFNALSPATSHEMAHAFDGFDHDESQRVAIITGAGDVFSAGGDISEMTGLESREEYGLPETGYGGLSHRFSGKKPVIAAVNGLALGGGFEVALACDLIIASETATFGLPEPLIGTAAVGGGMHRLVRQVALNQPCHYY